tara:strand:+ start:234 stop:1925 length:1692 start_codon:yes stop_codon:yes gene_type:complete
MSEYWHQSNPGPTGSGPVGTSNAAEDVNFETNYPYAFIDTMIANICPQNPQVTVTARREKLKGAAKFREALINDTFRRNSLHSLLWKTSTSTSICGRAFLKVVWNFRKSSPEVFSVDPRFVFFDMSAAKFRDIRYLVEVTVLTRAEFNARTKKQARKGAMYNKNVSEKAIFGGYPTFLKDQAREKSHVNEASHDVYKWVTVYEVYDFQGEGRYYHFLDDIEEPLFEGELPYRYIRNPFIHLTFNENMMDLAGLSDVKLVQSLQQRLNEIDTLELWHAHTSTPVMLVNTALADNPEAIMTALQDANQPGTMIAIQGKANAPLGDIIGQTPVPSFSPSFADMRDRCNQVIEFILGIPQYSRGVVGVADVATEVALADTATRTRNGRRIKQIEDVVSSAAERVIGLYEEFLDPDTKLPIRLTGSKEVLKASRESLMLRPERDSSEDPLDFDYDALPYSPTENHKLIQLQKFQQYLPLLLEAPNVNKEKLVTKLLDLLGMQDIIDDTPPAPPAPPPMMPGAPPPGAPPMMPGAPPAVDGVSTGGLPPGVAEPPPMPLPAGGPGFPLK